MKSTVRVWARLKAGHACQREKLAPSRAQTAAQSHLPGRKSPRSQWALKTATRGPEGRSPRWRLLLSDRRQDHAETTALHTGDGSPSAGAEKGREGLRLREPWVWSPAPLWLDLQGLMWEEAPLETSPLPVRPRTGTGHAPSSCIFAAACRGRHRPHPQVPGSSRPTPLSPCPPLFARGFQP